MRASTGWAFAAALAVATLVQGACVSARLVVGSGGAGGSGGDGGSGATGGGGSGGSDPSCACEALDILLVIDNSDSIDQFAIPLAQTFQAVSQDLIDVSQRACSYHYGVVTSTPPLHNRQGCQMLGALSHVSASQMQCDVANGIYATEEDNIAVAIPCLSVPGSDGDGGEQPIAAMFEALSPEMNAPGACNDGFFRPEAPLLIILISDVDDDVTPGGPAQWFGDLLAMNSGDSSQLAGLGVLGPVATPEPNCNAGVCTKLHGFLLEHDVANTAVTSICGVDQDDLQQGIERMAEALCPTSR